MNIPKIFESEYRFCCILWDNEPVTSSELVKLCAEKLGWKKSTTYTVIKRLSQRGVVRMEQSVVTSLVSREQVQRSESRQLIDRAFGGSLPSFIAAFTSGKALTEEEVSQIRQLIDACEETGHE